MDSDERDSSLKGAARGLARDDDWCGDNDTPTEGVETVSSYQANLVLCQTIFPNIYGPGYWLRGGGNEPGEREISSMFSRPISFGIEGPKMSKSRMPTRGRVGCKARDMARLTAGSIYVRL